MNIYWTDGTADCFYTAVFYAYGDAGSEIFSTRYVQLSFDTNLIQVQTDSEKAERVRKKIRQYDPAALEEISLLLRRGYDMREQIALGYIRKIVRERAPVRDRLSDPFVIAAMENVRKVRGEVHLFSGFLRFSEGANGVFYAPFEPDNDILELLVPHFLARLRCQPFIIHDVKRQTAALYNTTELVFTRTDQKVSVSLSDAEEDFQRLWKEYYRSVNIAERPHEKQKKGYMPVRYWKYMPEKREEN